MSGEDYLVAHVQGLSDADLIAKLERESDHAVVVAKSCYEPGKRAWIGRRNQRIEPDRPLIERLVAHVDGHVPIYINEYAITMAEAARRLKARDE